MQYPMTSHCISLCMLIYFLSLILISNSTSNILIQKGHSIPKYVWMLLCTKHSGALNSSSKILLQCGHFIVIFIVSPFYLVGLGKSLKPFQGGVLHSLTHNIFYPLASQFKVMSFALARLRFTLFTS